MTHDHPADALRIGGVQAFTTIDYPGAFAAVVFLQGCAWRCVYCHNPHLQSRQAAAGAPRWAGLREWLATRRGLLDAVVFSGGEPTLDPALPAAMAALRELGFKVGLHTAGMAPRRLRALLPRVDWVGLDVKAPLDDAALYQRITGVRGAAAAVRLSLAALQEAGVAFECRTTVEPSLLPPTAVRAVGHQLAAAGVVRHVLQPCRATSPVRRRPSGGTSQSEQARRDPAQAA